MNTRQNRLWEKTFRRGAALLLSFVLMLGTAVSPAFAAEKPALPTNTARSAVSMEADTGKIFYSKNLHYKRDPLSTTKVLTCLVALEHLELTDKVTVSKAAANFTKIHTDASTAHLIAGEKITVKDLIYACMLPSGNDAALALAHGVAGTTSEFAKLMNEKAEELGCVDSNFTNPHGWKAKKHYSSAYDMALITKAAMEVPAIEKACGTEIYKMAKTNKHKARKIATTNYLVAKKKYPNSGVYASKTGTWDAKNASLVSACERDGKIFYVVVLQDTTNGRYVSTNKIINFSYKKLAWMAEKEEPGEVLIP